LCIAIETRFVDYVVEALTGDPTLVSEAILMCLKTVADSSYRQLLLKNFLPFAKISCGEFQLSHLYHALSRADAVADLLTALRSSVDVDHWLLAYQIAFDLAENASQRFRADIIRVLPSEMSDVFNILTRQQQMEMYLHFLFNNCDTDIHILVALKESLDFSKMAIRSGIAISYSFMYTGTADDNFYRHNTPWFSSGRGWSQFVTIASVGAIHRGHLRAAVQVLQPFIAKGAPPYALGGALYALGLIYANYTWESRILEIVLQAMRNAPSPVIKHGGCLAVGLIALCTHNSGLYDQMAGVMCGDSPEAGEAAGYAMGMIMLGYGPCEQLTKLQQYTALTPHEKVMRGGAMGLALGMYGTEEKSDRQYLTLVSSQHPLMREGAAWTVALAYVGTASGTALQRLLHLAVSDVNGDVRRAAVIGVGFVLSKRPNEAPAMLDLLSKSYHAHVRSGAALAVGIACAGTGMPEAVEILKPLLADLEDFVKQSAMIAMAMVLQQQSDAAVPYCVEFRKYLRGMISKKKPEMQVFGLCLAYGILSASGRSVVISCNSLRGENSIVATVGLALFCNFFFWHPLALMLLLAFHPTGIIGLDKSLETPKWQFLSLGSKRLYANPPSFESEKKVAQIAESIQLSISKKKEEPKPEAAKAKTRDDEEDDEVDWQILNNASRVTLRQIEGIDLNYSERYRPVTGEVFHGFVMLKEIESQEEEDE
jgi:26S proteasome regulatory subunit N2